MKQPMGRVASCPGLLHDGCTSTSQPNGSAMHDPAALFERFWERMVEERWRDAVQGMNLDDDERTRFLRSLLCRDLHARCLAAGNATSAALRLPTDTTLHDTDDRTQQQDEILGGDWTAFHTARTATQAKAQADKLRSERPPSAEQATFIDAVCATADVDGAEKRLFFLQASAGTGKTHCLAIVTNELRGRGLQVRAMATSGIAAANLPRPSSTVHSACKVPLAVAKMRVPRCDVDGARRTVERRSLYEADVLIWDEACMAHVKMAAAIDRSCREAALPKSCGGLGPEYGDMLMQGIQHPSQLPFGGKMVILAGDWYQTVAIVPGGGMAEEIAACMFKLRCWPQFQQYRYGFLSWPHSKGSERQPLRPPTNIGN
eukprot:COSAG06_NODE_2252_length_7232_cov_11.789149_6_plen_374_part_00